MSKVRGVPRTKKNQVGIKIQPNVVHPGFYYGDKFQNAIARGNYVVFNLPIFH